MSSAVVERRAAKVALASGLSMGLSVALQLVSVPICLRYWGNEKYGLWLALIALFSVLRTLDAGFTAYVGNELNLLYHRDQPALRRTLASGLPGAILVGAVQLLVGGAILLSGSLGDLLGVGDRLAQDGHAGLALAILVLGWALTGPYLGVVHRLLVPAGMLYEATWWFMGFQVTQTAALVAAAAFDCSLAEAAAIFAAGQLFIYVASAYYIARKLPEYFPWWRRPSWRVGLRDFLRSSVLIGGSFLTQAGTSGLVVLVSSGIGAAAVPILTTVRTLANLWITLVNVLTAPLLPELVRYHAHREGAKLLAAFEAYWLIGNVAVNLSILLCLPLLEAVYRYWTGGAVELDAALLSYLLLAVAVGMPGALVASYLIGINQLPAATAIFAARGLVPLAAGFVLLPVLGVAGVGLGVALGELVGPGWLAAVFFRRQLLGLGVAPGSVHWGPVVAGTASLGGFLVARATGGVDVGVAHLVALLGVVASTLWGWRRVDAEVRERVLKLLRRARR